MNLEQVKVEMSKAEKTAAGILNEKMPALTSLVCAVSELSALSAFRLGKSVHNTAVGLYRANHVKSAIVAQEVASGLSLTELLLKIKLGRNSIAALAEAIDTFLLDDEEEEPVAEKEPVAEEEPAAEEPVAEEPAPVEETVPVMAEAQPENEEEDAEEEALPDLGSFVPVYIDVKEQPEAYAEMLEQERNNEVHIDVRYRRSFRSRVIQADSNVQEYYSALKNALLSYKGVKSRVSWGNDSFNKGRDYLAKINVKPKTIYLYLAIDPASLADTKYNFEDVSDKKKFEKVPVLMKIKGERKFKYALELIEKLCKDDLQLQNVKNFEAVDYTAPYRKVEEMVETGEVKKMAAAIPMEYYSAMESAPMSF